MAQQPYEGDERLRLYNAEERAEAAASTERILGYPNPELSDIGVIERWDGQEWEQWRGVGPDDMRGKGRD